MEKTFTDEELVTQFVESQETAYFTELYGRYRSKVYQSCLHILDDSDEAQDQTQEVFCKVFTRLPSFRHQASFSTWLFTITRNQCFTVRKHTRRHDPLDETDDADQPAYEELSLDDRWQIAERIMSLLSEQNQQLLKDRYLLGKDITDMAAEYGIGLSAMKMRLKRARDLAQTLHDRQSC